MPYGGNNPNTIPCWTCNATGWVRDSLTGKQMPCPRCRKRGWLPKEPDPRPIVRPPRPIPPKPPKTEIQKHRDRQFDKYMITKFYEFLLLRPFQLILSWTGSRKYKNEIYWKHYVSIIWWGALILTPFVYPLIYGNDSIVILVMGFFFLALIAYYGTKSMMELPP